VELEAEDLASGEPIVCAYGNFAEHFGFFLPLAGISTVRQITNNPIDNKATGRLNKLYVELLKDNEDWGTDARRHELNQFMARLIFCFFAESTGIFLPRLFTETIRQMLRKPDGDASRTGDLAFIATPNGRPMTKESFGTWFRGACKAAGVLGRAHGGKTRARPITAPQRPNWRQSLVGAAGWRRFTPAKLSRGERVNAKFPHLNPRART
jgi:hypothetical protein